MRETMNKLTQGATRLLVLALTLLAAGSVLAYASAGDLFEWNKSAEIQKIKNGKNQIDLIRTVQIPKNHHALNEP